MHFWGAGGYVVPYFAYPQCCAHHVEENSPEDSAERGELGIPPCPQNPCQPAGSRLMDSCRQQISAASRCQFK